MVMMVMMLLLLVMVMTVKPLGPREVSEVFVFPRLCAMAHAGIVKRPRGMSSVPAGGSHDPPRGDADDNDAAASDDDLSPRSFTPGSQDGISESSDFSLILHGEDLDGAKAKFSSLYRAEVQALFPHASRRSHSGKMSWMQRDIANSDWQRLREQAEHYLSNERLANWGNWVTASAQGHRSAGQRRE